MRQTSKSTVAKARILRRSMTQPEARLWQILRTRPKGLKFRRQHPAGSYVLDFYCPAFRLASEVDGMAHDMGNNPARDVRRDAWLQDKGYRVLRIPAREIGEDVETVLRHILNACEE